LFSPSVWGRFFGQTIDNRYSAFADPRASGNLGGFQGGVDLLRGPLIPGGYDRAGLYGAYGDVNSDVTGLVTNPAATAYALTHTGSMNLDAWSAGGYWTHVGPGGWYLDAVLQGTWYYGSASTQDARLNTDGTGFIGSLEGGVPFSWPQLGPGFVIEPQGQILWQKVSFRHDYDGEGDVALGDTTGPSARIGLRTKWTIVTAGGQVWQPYLRGNLWRDWGAEANTVFSGMDSVPLGNQATMLEFGGGLTGRINANVSVFANVDYEFAVGAGDDKRNGVRGAFGARYTW
jgi:outer membrane autotransporter protein